MSINCCEVCLAVILCTIITIVFYITSWYNHEEKEVKKKPDTSNLQGLENDQPIPRGEPNEILNFDTDRDPLTLDHRSSGIIKKEQSDIDRLQDEDFRSRVTASGSGESPLVDDYVNIEDQNTTSEYDPVVHPDAKTGRLHLSIRYDNERSQLIVRIVDAEGLIRPEQVYAAEMGLTFTLISAYNPDDQTEKHTRIVLQNAVVSWKEPMSFCMTFENVIKQNLYIYASNKSDPAAPRDREVSISLNNLGSHNEEMNEWFDLQFVQSSY